MDIFKKTLLLTITLFVLGCTHVTEKDSPDNQVNIHHELKNISVGISNEDEFTSLSKLWGKSKKAVKEIVKYEILNETDSVITYIGFSRGLYSIWVYDFGNNDQLTKYTQAINETDMTTEDYVGSFFTSSDHAAETLNMEPSRNIYPHSAEAEEKYKDADTEVWLEGLVQNAFHIEHTFELKNNTVIVSINSDHPDYSHDLIPDLDMLLIYGVMDNEPLSSNMCMIK